MNDKSNRNPMKSAATRVAFTAVFALAPGYLAGCKKVAPPEVEVTVQAAHPESGSIAEHVTADAILAPLAQAAIAPKPMPPGHCSARRLRQFD